MTSFRFPVVLTPLSQGPAAGQDTREEARSCSRGCLSWPHRQRHHPLHTLGFCEAIGGEGQTTRRRKREAWFRAFVGHTAWKLQDCSFLASITLTEAGIYAALPSSKSFLCTNSRMPHCDSLPVISLLQRRKRRPRGQSCVLSPGHRFELGLHGS